MEVNPQVALPVRLQPHPQRHSSNYSSTRRSPFAPRTRFIRPVSVGQSNREGSNEPRRGERGGAGPQRNLHSVRGPSQCKHCPFASRTRFIRLVCRSPFAFSHSVMEPSQPELSLRPPNTVYTSRVTESIWRVRSWEPRGESPSPEALTPPAPYGPEAPL